MNKKNKTKQLDDDKGPTSDDTKTTEIEIESDDDEDDDTDNEDTDSDESDSESDSETDSETTDYDVEMPTFTDYEEKYAPLRGRYNWHAHIPGLRLLWKRQLYPVELSVSNEWWVSHERSEWDYPLSRWRRKVRKMLHMKGPSAKGDLESGSLSLPDVHFDSSDDETEEGEDIEIRVVDVDGESKSVAENELVS
jgi:hypothetical protein